MIKYLYFIGISLLTTVGGIFIFYNYLPIEPIFNINGKGSNLIGSAITTINATDTLKNSRTTINDNFTALNAGKMEGSTTTVASITTLANLSTVGTITSGTWTGGVIGLSYGGTGRSSFTANALLLGNGTGAIATTSAGSNGQFLELVGGVPTWATSTIDQAANYTWTGSSTFATSSFNLFPTLPSSYPTASTSATNKGYVDYIASSSIHSFIGTATSTSSNVTATSTDVYVTGFTPKKITLYYKLNGKLDTSGTINYLIGIANFNGTTLKSNVVFLSGAAGTFADTTFSVGTSDLTVGTGNGTKVTLTITNLTSTGFTVTTAYVYGGVFAGANANFSVTATQ